MKPKLNQLIRNREILGAFLDLVSSVGSLAKNLADMRTKIAEGIEKGDLDGALETFQAANKRAKDYVTTGT